MTNYTQSTHDALLGAMKDIVAKIHVERLFAIEKRYALEDRVAALEAALSSQASPAYPSTDTESRLMTTAIEELLRLRDEQARLNDEFKAQAKRLFDTAVELETPRRWH